MNEEYDAFAEAAIGWGKTQLGSKDYIGLCLAFVENCYEKGNQIEMFGESTAKESAVLYEAAPQPGLPPKGAFVFYDCTGPLMGEVKNWGHVGLSMGDGRVLHSWGEVRVDPYLEVEKLALPPGWTSPVYIGWSPVERVLQGYQRREHPEAPAHH
jgi:cell wall-associated NlpC family hydrolase